MEKGEFPEELEFETYEHLANELIQETVPGVVQELLKDPTTWS